MTARVPSLRSLLTRAQVVDVLDAIGQPCKVTTWAAYVSRGQAPAPARWVGRTPMWRHADVLAWAANRPVVGRRDDGGTTA